jgi:hypothetical protein
MEKFDVAFSYDAETPEVGELVDLLCVGEPESKQKKSQRSEWHTRLEGYLEERRLQRELTYIDGWAEE